MSLEFGTKACAASNSNWDDATTTKAINLEIMVEFYEIHCVVSHKSSLHFFVQFIAAYRRYPA